MSDFRKRVVDDFGKIDEVGFAPLDDTGAQLLFRFVAAAYERRALGIASHCARVRPADECPDREPVRAHDS